MFLLNQYRATNNPHHINYHLTRFIIVALSDEFKTMVNDVLLAYVEDFKLHANEMVHTEKGLLSDDPQDFNTGHAVGFLEGMISTRFNLTHARSMNWEENKELRQMLVDPALEIKKIIFNAGR